MTLFLDVSMLKRENLLGSLSRSTDFIQLDEGARSRGRNQITQFANSIILGILVALR